MERVNPSERRLIINWRVGPKALQRIDDLAAERRESRSETLRVLIAAGLSMKDRLPAPAREVDWSARGPSRA
jgi:hypothetical protein